MIQLRSLNPLKTTVMTKIAVRVKAASNLTASVLGCRMRKVEIRIVAKAVAPMLLSTMQRLSLSILRQRAKWT